MAAKLRTLAPLAASAGLGLFVFVACGGANNSAASPTQPDPLVNQGKALYVANCQSCHGGATGGKMTDIPPPHNDNGHTWHHPDSQLIDITLNGLSFSVEGQQKMPPFKDKLTADDVKAILAYIKTWWTPQERAYQATVTAESDK